MQHAGASACLTASEIVADANGWTPWRGGECPVKPQMLLLIRLRFELDYDETQPPRYARAWSGWVHDGGEMDVVAFKVVEL